MVEEKTRRDLDFLPEAMVKEMLDKQGNVIARTGKNLRDLSSLKDKARNELLESGKLKNFAEEVRQRSYPTTAGVDGTRSRIMQLSVDTAAVAAVAVEGLVPPRESRIWEKPHHRVEFFLLEHSKDTDIVLRALMFSYELEMAEKAPHRIVMLDGSFTSTLVSTGQGFRAIEGENVPQELKGELKSRVGKTLQNFREVLTSPRMDQTYVALPKYTDRREAITLLQEDRGMTDPILGRMDDKGLLTVILNPQEYVGPLELQERGEWHLTGVPDGYSNLRDDIVDAMGDLHVVYLKPSPIHPALRAEIPSSVALDNRKLLVLLEALLDQTSAPGTFEPYPLHIADMFVKYVHGSLLELRESAISDMAKIEELDLSNFYLSLHDYRSERGFE